MARVSGIDLPRSKRIDIGLTYIYGIGRSLAKKIVEEAQVEPHLRVKDLTEDQINRLRKVIEQSCKVEGDLRTQTTLDIKRLIEVNAYRGIRHRRSLPVHGQRTSTNARTCKGPRKTIGVRRKK